MKNNHLPILLFFHGGILLISAVILESTMYHNSNYKAGIGSLFAILFVGFGGLLYLLPSYISALRASPRFAAIFGLNVVAGWSGIGWIAAVIWAFLDIKKENPQVIIQQVYTTPQQPLPVIYPSDQGNN